MMDFEGPSMLPSDRNDQVSQKTRAEDECSDQPQQGCVPLAYKLVLCSWGCAPGDEWVGRETPRLQSLSGFLPPLHRCALAEPCRKGAP